MEIGYWIRSDMAGRGICTLATKIMVLMGFEVMKLHRIQIGCDEHNLGSKRVIDKVGFVFEVLQRNMGYTSVTEIAIQNGWKGSGNTCTYSLVPDDLDALDWVEETAQHLQYEERNPIH